MKLLAQGSKSTRSLRVLAGLCLGSFAVMTAVPATSQDRRARRYEDVASQLGERRERDLDDALKEDLSHEPVEREEARPALDFEQFRRTVELQVASKRRSQIDTLSRIVQMGPSADEAPDLLFRLAELYWEEARYYFFESHAKLDDIIDAQNRNDQRRVRALEAEKESLERQSEDYRVRSIERYREIVRDYPEYERLDHVLFSLGSNLWEQDQADEALRVYGVLVSRFPDSDYVPDSYLAVAEHHFREGNVRVAQRGYERAVEFTDSRVYGYALYKLGWCYYNIGDFRQAGDLWRSVVHYGQLSTDIGGENRMALVREARRDFVLAYAHFGDPRQAIDVFKELGGDEHWHRMLRSLAGLYYDDGKNREAIVTFRILMELDPLSPEATLYQARIVDAAQRMGNKRFTVNQARVLVETFESVQEAGTIETDEDRKLFEEAEKMAERTLRSLAVTWHSEARKTRQEETYWYAYELYRDYLELFPSTEYEYQLRFYFAELLFHLEEWEDAGKQYTAVVKIDAERKAGERLGEDGRPEEVGEFLADAAFNAVLAYEELVGDFDKTEELPDVEPTEKIDVPPVRRALLDACERYLEFVPDGDDFVSITYMIANTYYRYNRLEEAIEKFALIALDHSRHELAEYSVNLILDSWNLLDRPDKVNKWARKFAANPVLARGSLGDEIREVIESSALTMTEAVAEEGNYREAAEAYEAFVAEFPDSDRADAALFNASVAWANSKDLDRALALRARIIRDYPNSKLVPEAIYTTAVGYESVVEWERAVEFYEMYFDEFVKQRQAAEARQRRARRGRRPPPPPDDEGVFEESKAQEALFQAAMLREGLGDYPRSRAHRLRYVDMWPESEESRALYRSVADLLEREGDVAGTARHLRRYMEQYQDEIDHDRRLVIETRRIGLLEKAGHHREVSRIYDEALNTFRSMGSDPEQFEGGLLPIAWAELKTIEPEFEAYRRVRFEYPWRDRLRPAQLTARLQRRPSQQLVNRLERGIEASDAGFRASLENKSQELQKVVARYTQIVQYRQAEPALCALERIGDAYHDFLEALKEAPSPPYLEAVYRLQLVVQEEEPDPDADIESTFRMGLQEQSLPLEEQAVEAWRAAVDNARQHGIRSECADRALEKVHQLRPGMYPEFVEKWTEPDISSPIMRKGSFLLTKIQDVPEVDSAEAGLPPDVASAPRPDGRAVRRGSASDSERRTSGRAGRDRTEAEGSSRDTSSSDRRGRRSGTSGGGELPSPDEDLF